MISQTVEYTLRAVVTIAQHDGRSITAKQIAKVTQVPAPYLSKLMQGLVRGGLVRSQRGLNGGFVLAEDPRELSVFDVVEVVEPFQRIRECPLGIRSHGGRLCPLHQQLDNAMEATEKAFRSTSIADLISPAGGSTPLCENDGLVALIVKKKASNPATPKKKKKQSRKP